MMPWFRMFLDLWSRTQGVTHNGILKNCTVANIGAFLRVITIKN